jgi:hypothetical protein
MANDAYHEEYVELLEILRREEQHSVGYESDQIYEDQIRAFERYLGQDYGDEQPARSSVHDRTVFEVIEWLRPDLERVFASGGNSVVVEPWEPGTDVPAQNASDFLNRLFFEEMDGGQIVDAFAFDGLLQKRGVGAVYWSEAELGEPETITGGQAELQMLAQQEVEILEVKPIDQMTGEVTFQRVVKKARPDIRNIAPEDFRIASRTTSLDKPRYCGHIERVMKSDLKLEFPDKIDLIEEYADASQEVVDQDERRATRFFDEDEMYKHEPAGDKDTAEIRLWREYIYYDQNGDGYAELLEVFRLDGCILHMEEVDDNPYFSWTPVPIPHRWFGLSIYDIAKDIQKTNTVLLRGALDSVYLSIAPRTLASKNVNLSDLLTVRPGGIVRTNGTGPVGQDVMPLVTPDMSGPALQMLEWMRQQSETRTGVTRNAQGMDPDALNKTATGIKLMQNAASVRKEQIARNLGRGLEMMFRKMYRLLVSNVDKPQQMHMGKGKFEQFNPSQWAPEAKIRIHVGNGSGDRETQLGQLMTMLSLQREVVANYGLGNPIVTAQHLHATMEDIGRTMGMRSIDQYFADPKSVDPEAMKALTAPKPDPKAEEAKMKMQAQAQENQARIQSDAQVASQKAQLDAAARQQKQQQDHEYRMEQLALDRWRLDKEYQFKAAQAVEELNLKEWSIGQELQMKERVAKAKPNGASPGGSGQSVNVGGDPG